MEKFDSGVLRTDQGDFPNQCGWLAKYVGALMLTRASPSGPFRVNTSKIIEML